MNAGTIPSRNLARVIYIVNGTPGDDRLIGSNSDNYFGARAGNDTIRAGGGNDILNGEAGNDTLDGEEGTDLATYEGAGAGVTVKLWLAGPQDTGAAGIDTLISIEDLLGSVHADVLHGDAGANVIDGGRGADLLHGARGDDTYYVTAGDTVLEYSNAGFDTVYASESFTLGSNIETLILTGTVSSDATGNMLANLLVGTDGNNMLDGRGGDDTMEGLRGNDTYRVNTLGDTVIEQAGGGSDTVLARISWVLGDNFENLVLEGLALRGTGNEADNAVIGNAAANTLLGRGGDDRLEGSTGADLLIGGAGRDLIYLGDDSDADRVRLGAASESTPGAARDLIFQFTPGTDLIDLHQLDADAGSAFDQAFTYSATGPAAHAVWTIGTTHTLVRGDLDGDAVADFEIQLMNVTGVTAADFLL